MSNRILYFSINSKTEAVFCEFVEQHRYSFKDAFRLERINAQHVSDLFEVLDSMEDVSRLFVIVDYISFYSVTDVASPGSRNEKYDLPVTAAKHIRRAILKYPEVNFLFDESGLPHDVNFTTFLFPDLKNREGIDRIFIHYHQFRNSEPEPFLAIINGRNNLFDGTNLRNAIKRYLYLDLKCSRRNFSLVQDSRRESLAICVEEEISQNRFNSFAAYSNGYRVLPVITCSELQELNNATRSGIIDPRIVIRDYDLQFSDVVQEMGASRLRRVIDEDTLSTLNGISKQTIFRIRNQEYTQVRNIWYESIPVNKKINRSIKDAEELIINEICEAEHLTIIRYEDGAEEEKKKSSQKIELNKTSKGWALINNNKESTSILQVSELHELIGNKSFNPLVVLINSGNNIYEYSRNNGVWFESVPINEIDRIRGAKYNDKRGIWYALNKEELIPYWDGLVNRNNCKVYFISKGGPRIITTASKFKKEREKSIGEAAQTCATYDSIFLDGVEKQIVRGLEKPVSGLYLPFHSFFEFKSMYNSFGESELFIRKHAVELASKCADYKDKLALYKYLKEDGFFKTHFISAIRIISAVLFCKMDKNSEGGITSLIEIDRHKKEQGWVIRTDRENHNHGVPLDLYDLANGMISRASDYYGKGRFIKAAVISSEAIEVLNGFHEALMLQAYHILATSENAIAMNTIGGSESALAKDAKFRIKKIEHDVDRMLARSRKDRRDLKYNILNQIFIDCRSLCQAKEHFMAEDCFISALAHVNEGFTLCDIGHELLNILRAIRNSWEAYFSEHTYEKID